MPVRFRLPHAFTAHAVVYWLMFWKIIFHEYWWQTFLVAVMGSSLSEYINSLHGVYAIKFLITSFIAELKMRFRFPWIRWSEIFSFSSQVTIFHCLIFFSKKINSDGVLIKCYRCISEDKQQIRRRSTYAFEINLINNKRRDQSQCYQCVGSM